MAPPEVVQCSTLIVVPGSSASERPKMCKDGSAEEGDNFLLRDQGRFH